MDTAVTAFSPDRHVARMRDGASWATTWALGSALTIAAIVLRAPVSESLALSQIPPGTAPERVATVRQIIAWSTWLGAGTAPLALLVKYAFWAGTLFLLALCVGKQRSFRRVFALVAYASVALAVDAALTGGFIRAGASAASGLPTTALSLTHFVDLSGWPLIRAAFDEVGLFPLLYWWLMWTGLVQALKLSRGQATGIVAVMWLLRMSIVAAMAAIATLARGGL